MMSMLFCNHGSCKALNKTVLKQRICNLFLILCVFMTGCNIRKGDVAKEKYDQNKVENSETANEDLLHSMDYEYIDYESIEKDHEILEYNICTSPNYDYNNTILSECLKKDIEYDNEMCSEMGIASPLEIEYFLFDFNADNLEDYLVCMHGYLWGGSGGNTVRIYIQEKEGTLKKVLDITMRLHEPGLPDEHAPMAVLNEITDGYYAIVLPWNNLIMRYEKDEETYCFMSLMKNGKICRLE